MKPLLSFALVFTLLFSACATTQLKDTINGDRPAMWRISDENSEIFLFGTFHLLPDDVQWQSPLFGDAMAKTAHTVIEADTQSLAAQEEIKQAVIFQGLNPAGVTLSSILGPKRSAEFSLAAQEVNLTMAMLDPLRPWLAVLTYTISLYQKLGFDPAKGVEREVLQNAEREKDQILFLESPLEQVLALTSLDDEEIWKDFDPSLDDSSNFETELNEQLEAWRSGNLEAMGNTLLKDTREETPKVFDAIFLKRNKNWVKRISEILEGEGGYFIAVGAGHLVGEESVIDLLKKRGITVQRIQ